MDKGKKFFETSDVPMWGKLGLVLMVGALLSKSLIQFSVEKQNKTKEQIMSKVGMLDQTSLEFP